MPAPCPDGSRESRHRGLSFLLVDHDSRGLVARPIAAASGRNEFAEISFDGVVVPADRLVGELGSGWESAMYLLQWERGMYAWQRQASLHHELEQALRHAGSIAAGSADTVGAAYRSLHALRLASRRTLRSLSRRQNPGPIVSVDKILLATAEQAVHALMRELMHPMLELGDSRESGILRADYLYARTASIYGGSAEVQRTILADQVLRLPKESIR